MSTVPILDQLRPIHLPDPIGVWPLAWGWLVIGLVTVIVVLTAGYWSWRWYWDGRAKREALRLLTVCEIDYRVHANSQQASAMISELLKRVALVYCPRDQVAHLYGEPWLMFLQNTSKRLDVMAQRDSLLICPYQTGHTYPLDGLFNVARCWIKQRRKPCLS